MRLKIKELIDLGWWQAYNDEVDDLPWNRGHDNCDCTGDTWIVVDEAFIRRRLGLGPVEEVPVAESVE